MFLKHLKNVNGMDEDKLLQLSMDGPNLNTSLLTSLNEERMDRELSHLVLVGLIQYTTHSNMEKMLLDGI